MARKQPEVTAETKQKLMEAYWELYTSDIPGKITVKMITDRAGITEELFMLTFWILLIYMIKSKMDYCPPKKF